MEITVNEITFGVFGEWLNVDRMAYDYFIEHEVMQNIISQQKEQLEIRNQLKGLQDPDFTYLSKRNQEIRTEMRDMVSEVEPKYGEAFDEIVEQISLDPKLRDDEKIVALNDKLDEYYAKARPKLDKDKLKALKKELKEVTEDLKPYIFEGGTGKAEQDRVLKNLYMLSRARIDEVASFMYFLDSVYDRDLAKKENSAKSQVDAWMVDRLKDEAHTTWLETASFEEKAELDKLVIEGKKLIPTSYDGYQELKDKGQGNRKTRRAKTKTKKRSPKADSQTKED